MACERFEKRLIEEAVAPGGDPTLAEHLAECADCRAELASQRALQERITMGVADMVAEGPSPALLMRVRAQIAAESATRRFAWLQWGAVGVAATALAGFALWYAVRPSIRQVTPELNTAKTSQGTGTPQVAGPVQVAVQQPLHKSADQLHTQATVKHVAHKSGTPTLVIKPAPAAVALTATASHGEVLVAPGQREAVLRLVNALRSGRVDAASLVRPPQPGNFAPLEIAPIEVKPLVGANDKDGGNDKDKNDPGNQNNFEF